MDYSILYFLTLLLVMATFSIVSLNCNGLCDSSKRNCIFALCNERKYDIVCLQETFWTDELYHNIVKDKSVWDGDIFACNSLCNRQGVAILISRKLKHVFKVMESINGRLLHISGRINDKCIDVINVYAPNSINEKCVFFDKCKNLIYGDEFVVVAGDFNTALSPLDRSGKTGFSNDKSVRLLNDLSNEKGLFDVWRDRNPNVKMFSRKQVVQGFLTQSRIDYFLVSGNMKPCIKNIFYKDTSFSDHCIVSMNIDFSEVEKGPGVWIFNQSLLEDEFYVEKIRKLFCKEIGTDFYFSHPLIWWDNLKYSIKRISQIYGKEKQRELNKRYYIVQNKLQEMSVKSACGIDIDFVKYLELKDELEKFENHRCNGAVIRSKCKFALESDKNTSYFLRLESYRQNKNMISSLKNSAGHIVSETSDLLNVVHDYYKKLFSCVETNCVAIDEMLNCIDISVDNCDAQSCDAQICVDEIEKSLKGMKKGKTPGPDGLTVEFYCYFFKELKPILKYIYDCIETNETLSRSMKYGMINLIYKNRGDKTDLKNFRPISLLNVDYKILARIMANRFKYVLPKVISSTQTCCIVGKDISDTIVTVRDIIDYVEMDDLECYMLKLDQEKAFDRVCHDYLFSVLEKFGFGKKFISWIKIFYKDIFSTVKCNGFLSKYFPLKNSVKQGCPISALLYVLVAEPLSIMIKKNDVIKGIKIPIVNIEEKVFSHADDTTLLLSDKNSVDESFKVLQLYEQASGAKLNKDKSEILALGTGKILKSDLDAWKIRECHGVLQLLGIWIGKDKHICENLNWDCKVQSITKTLNFWKMRNLSIHGRATVINTLLMSKLWYTLLVVNIPEKYYLTIKKLCTDFLWNYKPALVAYDVVINRLLDGGLNFAEIMYKMYSFRLKFLSRLLDDEYCVVWKHLCNYFLSKVQGMNLGVEILLCSFKQNQLGNLPEFYKCMLYAWGKISDGVKIDFNVSTVFHMPLFQNPLILNDGKMLFLKTFIDAGIVKIKDLAFECKKGFMSDKYIQDIVSEKFPEVPGYKIVKAVSCIKQCIPTEFKAIIDANTNIHKSPVLKISCNINGRDFSLPSTSKAFYEMLLKSFARSPRSVIFWSEQFSNFNVQKIQKVLNFSLFQREWIETSFKVFHRVVFTKERLMKCHITVDSMCPLCKNVSEDLEHLLITCRCLKLFNDFFKDLLHNILINSSTRFVNMLDYDFLCYFGMVEKDRTVNYYFVNLVLAVRKFCVLKRRNIAMKDGHLVNLISYFKSVLQRHICFTHEYYKNKNDVGTFKKFYEENNPILHVYEDTVQIDF